MDIQTEIDIEEWKAKIDGMSQMSLARLLRFAPAGHPVFRSDLPLYDYFKARFESLGGMTPAISKAIGH